MSNMSQLFDASRFPGHVKVQSAGKAAVMTRKPEACDCSPYGMVQFFLSTGSIPKYGLWHKMKRPTFCC